MRCSTYLRITSRALRDLSRLELAEVQRLRRRHELDSQNTISVIEDLSVLEGGVHAHRDEVLLVRRGRDGLDARRRRKDPLLHDQMVGGVLAEHHPGVKARLMGQEIRQSLRKSRVRQSVQAPLR